MTLSTVGGNNVPSARVVLLKGFDERGFVFFTNYESRKARDLSTNPNAVISFFWKELERQVIIVGTAEKTSREESEGYFKTRPVKSRLSAWASKQSSLIESRRLLEQRIEDLEQKFGDEVPCPPFWGGFRIAPTRFEFWQGRPSRLHDRICYELTNREWQIYRLSP
jgi:pyridoxamine 5'-phosphate oxidase